MDSGRRGYVPSCSAPGHDSAYIATDFRQVDTDRAAAESLAQAPRSQGAIVLSKGTVLGLVLMFAWAGPSPALGQTLTASPEDTYWAFIDHTDNVLTAAGKFIDSPTSNTKQLKKLFVRMRDWSAKENRWLGQHTPDDCYETEWGYWAEYMRLINESSVQALNALKVNSAKRMEQANGKVVRANAYLDDFRATSSAAACASGEQTALEGALGSFSTTEPTASFGTRDDVAAFFVSQGIDGERNDLSDGRERWLGQRLAEDPFVIAEAIGPSGAVEEIGLTTAATEEGGALLAMTVQRFAPDLGISDWIVDNLERALLDGESPSAEFDGTSVTVSGLVASDGALLTVTLTRDAH